MTTTTARTAHNNDHGGPVPEDHPQPHDLLAERALLGCMLLNPAAATAAEQHITVADFYNPVHTTIATTILARTSRNKPLDPILVSEDLLRTKQLHKLPGGAAYLLACIEACPDPSHVTHYAHIVANHAAARRLLALSEDLVKAAAVDDPERRHELLTQARTGLDRATGAKKTNGHNIRLTPASKFKIKAVKWVWEGRMPLGEITLIPGREGVGKSTFLAWLASAITNGNLPGLYHGQPRAVLYAASEDAWSYTIAPRMLAAGANLDLVYRIDVEEDDGTVQGLILPRDCRHLPDIANEVDAAALMCDPIMSLVDGNINNFKSQELRTALEPLRRAAEEARIAVPALVHFNKSAGTDINTLIAGSRAWVEVARAVIAIAQDKEADDYTCIVSQAKNNLGRSDLPNLVYTIDSVELETDEEDNPAHVGRLRWTGESDVSVEDLLNGVTDNETLSDNTLAIIDFVEGAEQAVSVQEVADHFKDQIKYETVKKTLARCVKRSDLVSPSRGRYTSAKKPKATRKGRYSSSPLYPPVPVSPVSPPQVRGLIGVSLTGTVGTRSGVRDTGTLGTGDPRPGAHTHAREYDATGEESSPQTEIPLTSCTVCFGPLVDVDGSRRHSTCQPPTEGGSA